MFYVGQKVVSLVTQSNNIGISMKEGQLFIVRGNYECACGNEFTDIGLACPIEYDYSICPQCGKYIYTGGITVCEAKDLAPLEDWEQAEELVNELTEDFAMS